MPYCSILECGNNSGKKNLNNGGISYHRFPKDPGIREKWIAATGRINWMPTKTSTICSNHFSDSVFKLSLKGQRSLLGNALPTLKVLKFYQKIKYKNTSFLKKPQKPQMPKDSAITTYVFLQEQDDGSSATPSSARVICVEKNDQVSPVVPGSNSFMTPTEMELKKRLRFCADKIKKQALKIKRLQTESRRLRKKLHTKSESKPSKSQCNPTFEGLESNYIS